MHDPAHQGTPAFFVCDFCRKPWSDDNPMVEGHRGSLICASCLGVAYVEINAAQDPTGDESTVKCVMCLEDRPGAHWRSPLHDEACICKRCCRQSATTLANDPDFQWNKPER
ncbi:MAG: hypothetical protein H6813_04900 [Phycisphaeraceae bacterium]|nr:hypothetical protein [Phycisphaeraceae bacterium]MCB9847722.1 hypothetical protein [Phycisphaeraceae bacterium]